MNLKLKIFLQVVFIWSLSNSVFAEQIRLEKSTLSEFSRVVSDYLDKPIIVAQDLNKPFSINAKFQTKDDLKQLFKTSILASGLSYDETDLSIVVSASSAQSLGIPSLSPALPASSSILPSANFYDAKPLVVVVYPLKNLSSSYLYQVLTKLDSRISVMDSSGNNSLIVTASKDDHKNIKKIVSALDFPVKQILIEAVISELSDKDYQGLDAKLENYRRLDGAVDSLTPYVISNPLASLANFGMKLLTSKSLRFFLDWVQTSDSSSVLSRPKIVTLDRKQASIVVGQNVPFITGKSTSQASSTSTPFQTIERQDIGLKLQVTPVILPNGLVELSILQESSSVDIDTTASDIVTNKRAVTSTALVRDGDTLLLGGLSSSASSGGHTSTIPDGIPLLSWFFSGNTKKESNTNLVVLITAKVINPALPENSLQGDFQAEPPIFDKDGFDVPVAHHK